MTEKEEKVLVWKKKTWMGIYPLYQRLLDYLSRDVNFMTTFTSTIDPTETDFVARSIVNIFLKTGHLLDLINAMIYTEFSKVQVEGEGSVMRGNNIINKIEGIYVREIGGAYLKLVVGDLVTKIATDQKLSLEIDPRKINLNDEAENIVVSASPTGPKPLMMDGSVDAIVAQNRKKLLEYSQAFLNRITDMQMVEEMPKEIRQIAARTAQCARKFTPDSMNPLIGGFIMLRFFSPAIATPESSKLISPDVTPSPRANRNLVLVAKVLQNASNGLLFGAKEEFMTCMNDFIIKNKAKMNQYFLAICRDPVGVQPSGAKLRASSERYLATTVKETKTIGTISRSPPAALSTSAPALTTEVKGLEVKVKQTIIGSKKPSSVSSSPVQSQSPPTIVPVQHHDIDLRSIDLQDLFDLHRVLDTNMEKIKVKYSKGTPTAPEDDSVQSIDNFSRISNLLKELGPSPKSKQSRKTKDLEEELDPTSLPAIQSTQTSFDDVIAVLERARFLYQGPNDKHDQPVFYLIVNRIKPEFLDNVNPLVSHIFKVMDEAVNLGYSLIIDMSWASISNELKKVVYTHLPNLAKIFSRRYKKNVLGIYVVHPSAYTRAVVHFMRFFTSRKLKRKIIEIYNWKQLAKIIDTENILLPETSKDYITKSYRLIKVNAKGKRQERLIKFTANSLLNIDPKTKKLQNEKRIDEIEEISSIAGTPDLSLRFDVKDSELGVNKGIFNFSSDKDLVFRRYVCSNIQERDSILQDIYEMGFKSHWMRPAPEFKVIKVNQAGKHQERMFRLTIDSLLNLANNQIKSETSFAGIEIVSLDPIEPDTLWLKLKTETFKRKLICKDQAKLLVDALNEAVNRYAQVAENEEGHFRQEGDEEYGG